MLGFSSFAPSHFSPNGPGTTATAVVTVQHGSFCVTPSASRCRLPRLATDSLHQYIDEQKPSTDPMSTTLTVSSSSSSPSSPSSPSSSSSPSPSQTYSHGDAVSSLSRRSFLSHLSRTLVVITGGALLGEGTATAMLQQSDRTARADAISSQLTAYRDLPKGFTILRPNGWNEFEGLQDNYDIKWQDVIQPLEFITVLTSPVSSDRGLSDLGTVDNVGQKLAKSRDAELVNASERSIDGVPAYVFEMKREQAHQITLLCVSKMKLYSVNVSASERRWTKREKLLRAVVNSFKPKL